MIRITIEQAGGLNVAAFMEMLKWSEGTSTSPITKDDGYDIIVNSVDAHGHLVHNRFDDYSKHPFEGGRPSLAVNTHGGTSNASGAYQQMLRDWPYYRNLLKLHDFGPMAQDVVCVQHIKECRAIPMLQAGRFEDAVDACKNIWASLTGSTYGQPTRSIDDLRAVYSQNDGES